MRYYTIIMIDFNTGTIELWDIPTPYTKIEAQRYAEMKASIKKSSILCIIETMEIQDRDALERFNLKNLEKGGIL